MNKYFLCKLTRKFGLLLPVSLLLAYQVPAQHPLLDHQQLASMYFKEDAGWYLDKIPFFECSDKQMEQVYYYRWKLYKAHIRTVGDNAHVITEFIDHVAWDREPYCTINAASMHHIYEGRWLKDNRYLDGYIDNLYQHGGNNRSYSESVADAAYARYLVNADSNFVMQQLDSMQRIFTGWYDHFDSSKNMYYIPAMPDATEYTIASIDASGGTAGFAGGEAFRPTINSYMYANAMAISKIAAMKGDRETSKIYLQKAMDIKSLVEKNLWNDSLQHFTDRFKVDNEFVHYWNFIRGRELAGMAPWYFNLPSDNARYNAAWNHLTGEKELLGKHGFRTNEPSYQYYFKQFVFCFGKPGSQWNGPSWPYQSSQALTGMANFLNNYHQNVLTTTDYVNSLRLFTKQHFLPDGSINLVENYDPNTGGPIVYYYWSNHYNHSSYNNLVITGLCGIRPSADDQLVLNPLVDNSISYFCLDDVAYHGHRLTVVYDRDGSRYHLGKGLIAFVDGEKASLIKKDGKYAVAVGRPLVNAVVKEPVNHSLNILYKGYPSPSASVNNVPDSLFQAIDGRCWYFPEISNRWSTLGSKAPTDWYAVDFGASKNLSTVKLSLFADGKTYTVPEKIGIEYLKDGQWLPININSTKPLMIIGNTSNDFMFDSLTTTSIRIQFTHTSGQVGLVEVECF